MNELKSQLIVNDITRQYSAIISIDKNNKAYVRYQHNFDMSVTEEDIPIEIITDLCTRCKGISTRDNFELVAY